MLKVIRHIARDERGNAVVDFAFLLPIMLMLYIGVVEVTNVLSLDRKVVDAAETVADLVTQRSEVSDADLNDILRAAELIMEPYPSAAQTIGIAGVRYDEDTGNAIVDWTKSRNGGSVPNAQTLATGLGGPGEGVIVVRVTYSYTPIFFDFVMDPTTIEETAILRPRRSYFVEGPGA